MAARRTIRAADPARTAEIAAIHVAKKRLGLAEEDYRAVLARVGGKSSAADLDAAGRHAVLDHFRGMGFERAAAKPRKARAAEPAASGDRPQQRKIKALWLSLYNLGAIDNPSGPALDAYMARATGVSALRFADAFAANKAIEGLKAMCARAGFVEPEADAPPVARTAGEKARFALIRAQWKALADLGAFRHGMHANLGTWIARRNGVSAPEWLDAHQADARIAELGAWIRREKAKKDDGK